MPVIREKQAHIWERDPLDWYVEPPECSAALFRMEAFEGLVWDPACGLGRIVEQARVANLEAVGSDVVRRSEYCERKSDFLQRTFEPNFKNIVTNPPFGKAEEFVREAIRITPQGGKVAVILPLVWVSGFSSKRDWLPHSPLRTLYPISPRPSMPPGKVIEAGVKPGNGTKDFAWLVWEVGYTGQASVKFMNTNTVKQFSKRTGARKGVAHGKGVTEWAGTA
ncbi:MAG: hypothetical protein ACTHLT_04110 [Devosia sp.]